MSESLTRVAMIGLGSDKNRTGDRVSGWKSGFPLDCYDTRSPAVLINLIWCSFKSSTPFGQMSKSFWWKIYTWDLQQHKEIRKLPKTTICVRIKSTKAMCICVNVYLMLHDLVFFDSLYFSELIAKTYIFRDLSPYWPCQELLMISLNRYFQFSIYLALFDGLL